MTPLDMDAQLLVERLVDVMERKEELAMQEGSLKAELRARLHVGEKYADSSGVPRIQAQPNRRFSTSLALKVVPLERFNDCLTRSLDPRKVKQVLAPELYEQCMETFDPKIVLL